MTSMPDDAYLLQVGAACHWKVVAPGNRELCFVRDKRFESYQVRTLYSQDRRIKEATFMLIKGRGADKHELWRSEIRWMDPLKREGVEKWLRRFGV